MRSPWHRHPAVRTGNQLSRGERAADATRNTMGSWGFVGAFLVGMAVWMVANSIGHIGGPHGFDKYPYVLANLMLSLMAGLQGAILLIAAKRADQISSEVALHTERTTDEVKTLLEQNTDLTAAVHEMQQQMHDLLVTASSGKYEKPPEDVPRFLRDKP